VSVSGKKLTTAQKLGFGVFDLGGNLLFTLMGFWCLKYLTDTAGLAAALAGAALMAGKVWDAVTDPLMGYISDRTVTALGRRRPSLLAGALPMMLTLWLFFTAPPIRNPVLLTLWMTFSLMLVNTVSTVINIPYSSLTPELTDDYHERTSLNGYRFGCAIFGTIIGAAAVLPLIGLFADKHTGWSMTGLALGAVIMITTLLTFFGTRESPRSRALPAGNFFSTYRAVFCNRPYVILFLAYGLHMTAVTFLQSIIAYYIEYLYPVRFVLALRGILRMSGESALRGALTTLAMLVLLLTAMLCIPLSVALSRRAGKKRVYQISFVLIGTACAAVSLAGHRLPPPFFLALLAWAGAGVGFSYVAPFAMAPDAIDYGALTTGQRDEGAYYGMWTFIAKTGMALSVFLSGLILELGGYAPNAVQGPGAKLAIRFIAGPIPALIFAAAFAVLRRYPLDEDACAAMKRGVLPGVRDSSG
jgi:GPH family glycoside/pentoside/hexuronide:cation symporter